MARELITTWAEYQTAIDRMLAIACHRICIYDEDLTNLKLESSARLDHLKRLLAGQPAPVLRIAVRNGGPLRHAHPRLQNLLTTYGHLATAQETPSQIAHLRDSMDCSFSKLGRILPQRPLRHPVNTRPAPDRGCATNTRSPPSARGASARRFRPAPGAVASRR